MKTIRSFVVAASAAIISVGLLYSDACADPASTTLQPSPQNFDFEAPLGADGVPEKWATSDQPVVFSLDKQTKHGGNQSVKLVGQRGAWVTLTSRLFQRISAEKYRGKRARFSAWIKTEDIDLKSSIWIAAFTKDDTFLKSDALMGKPDQEIVGTNDWKQYTVEIDVPQDAFRISLGFEMASRGIAWVDDLTLEIVQ
jgi:hypothetical protein